MEMILLIAVHTSGSRVDSVERNGPQWDNTVLMVRADGDQTLVLLVLLLPVSSGPCGLFFLSRDNRVGIYTDYVLGTLVPPLRLAFGEGRVHGWNAHWLHSPN